MEDQSVFIAPKSDDRHKKKHTHVSVKSFIGPLRIYQKKKIYIVARVASSGLFTNTLYYIITNYDNIIIGLYVSQYLMYGKYNYNSLKHYRVVGVRFLSSHLLEIIVSSTLYAYNENSRTQYNIYYGYCKS